MKEAFVANGKETGGRPADPREKYYNPCYKKNKGKEFIGPSCTYQGIFD